MRDKNQVLFFSESELTLIKNVFGDNDELLYAIRNVLLQFPLSKAEQEMIDAQITPEVYAVIKKRIFPYLNPDAPLSQLGDYRSLLTEDLKNKGPEELAPLFAARMLEMRYIEQQLAQLIGLETVNPIQLNDLRSLEDKDDFTRYVEAKAYLDILGYVDPQLNHLKVIAGTKSESIEKQKDRLTRNSSK